MAERLTNTLEETPTLGFGLKFCSDRNCNSDEDCCNCYAFNQTINKLRQLEDIMEKYGIESVEELKDTLENKIEDISNPFLQGYVRAFFKDRLQYVEFERDIWKRACELACEDLQFYDYGNEKTEDGIIMKVDYFYQQAKKETK